MATTGMTINEMVRSFMSDTDSSSQWKTDEDIQDAIFTAVAIVEIDYYQGYTISNKDETTISPTPDNTSKILIALQAAIILVGGEVFKSSREGIMVRDGDTLIDTTKGADSKRLLFDKLIDRYENMIFSLNANSSNATKGYRIDMY